MLLGSDSPDYIVAPFWVNTDINNATSSVSYEVHNMSTSPELLSRANAVIRELTEDRFAGTFMLLVEWNISQSGQLSSVRSIIPS